MPTVRFCLIMALLFSFPAKGDNSEGNDAVTASAEALSETSSASGVTTQAIASSDGGYGKPHGVFGPLTIGPKISALGFPSPLRGGIEAKWENSFGIGFDFGFLPLSNVYDTRVKTTAWMGSLRYYPWQGAFYVGLGAGTQNFSGTRVSQFNGADYSITLSVDSILVVPQVGWRWVWESGFFLGVEAGVQVSVSNTQTVTTDAATIIRSSSAYQQQLGYVQDQADVLASLPLPQFAALQVGYFF